ncbi:MAG TPA: hypothetical protein VLL82_02730 [Mycobacterium sp.]|nr:hypothetical protein [Mycobacterium sp.]
MKTGRLSTGDIQELKRLYAQSPSCRSTLTSSSAMGGAQAISVWARLAFRR